MDCRLWTMDKIKTVNCRLEIADCEPGVKYRLQTRGTLWKLLIIIFYKSMKTVQYIYLTASLTPSAPPPSNSSTPSSSSSPNSSSSSAPKSVSSVAVMSPSTPLPGLGGMYSKRRDSLACVKIQCKKKK